MNNSGLYIKIFSNILNLKLKDIKHINENTKKADSFFPSALVILFTCKSFFCNVPVNYFPPIFKIFRSSVLVS